MDHVNSSSTPKKTVGSPPKRPARSPAKPIRNDNCVASTSKACTAPTNNCVASTSENYVASTSENCGGSAHHTAFKSCQDTDKNDANSDVSSVQSGRNTYSFDGDDEDARLSLRDAFDCFDVDKDGRITCSELSSVLKLFGMDSITDAQVKRMIDDADIDGNGTVEFDEFHNMMKRYYQTHQKCHTDDLEMWEAFKAFDHNNDNYIDFNELKNTMMRLGETVSDADVREMIREADSDNDGRINFEEFKKMMKLMQQEKVVSPR